MRDYEAVFEWAPPLLALATMIAAADDSIHFFGVAAGAGGNGLDVYVENSSSGFSLQQAFDGSSAPVVNPSLTRGRGELGALWKRAGATPSLEEIWGAVF